MNEGELNAMKKKMEQLYAWFLGCLISVFKIEIYLLIVTVAEQIGKQVHEFMCLYIFKLLKSLLTNLSTKKKVVERVGNTV